MKWRIIEEPHGFGFNQPKFRPQWRVMLGWHGIPDGATDLCASSMEEARAQIERYEAMVATPSKVHEL